MNIGSIFLELSSGLISGLVVGLILFIINKWDSIRRQRLELLNALMSIRGHSFFRFEEIVKAMNRIVVIYAKFKGVKDAWYTFMNTSDTLKELYINRENLKRSNPEQVPPELIQLHSTISILEIGLNKHYIDLLYAMIKVCKYKHINKEDLLKDYMPDALQKKKLNESTPNINNINATFQCPQTTTCSNFKAQTNNGDQSKQK
ncbi:MAG: hypothetical protein LBM01_03040 [Christensenellaceae bacterium]|jgi:hypothetical protein|nr:hypothetical protein [Christensenellaceae bacterium]